jgi:ankyrin repeat protein
LADLANRVDNSGRTMLHYACHGNSEKFHQTVKILLETFPNINFSLRDMYGKTAMDYALSVNAVNTAITITTKLGNIDELLLKSCKLKLRDLIKFIIQEIRLRGEKDVHYGLNFVANIKDEDLRTPLHIICDNPSPFISRSETWNIFLRIPWVQSFMATYLEMGDSQGNTPLHLACCLTHYDNLEVIDFLSSLLGADWTAKNKLGDTPLHALCKLKNQDYCRKNPKKLRSILTNYNVNLFLANAEGDTFLHFDAVLDYLLPVFDESEESLAYSDYDEKYSCLDWDACFRILNGKRQSILFTTVISGNLSLSKRLLELNNRGLSATDYLGNNLLHYSCSQSVAMMKIVLAHCGEAELTAVNLSGQTPMHVLFDRVKKRELAEDEEIEIMDLLFQNKDDWIGSLSVQDVNGCTPLHYLASVTLRVAWLMALIPVVPKHCMVLQDNQGQTILHVCCKNDNMDFLNPSYEHFSLLAPAIGIPDAQGNTPIHCVSLLGGDETLRNLCLLVESSHTVFNSQNADGITPLMCCLKRMNSASVLRLLSYQSLDSLSAYDKNGNTALHYACEYNMETAVGLVLEAGAFLSSLGNSDADLPIHVAARKRNVEIFFKLLPVTASHNKVEPVITNAKKENVLHMVTGWKVSYVAAVLDQINIHDAIMQQNIAGDTPLHCAIRLSHVDSIQLLLKHYEYEGESIVLTNDMGRNILHVACANFAETDGDIESKLSVLRLVLQFVRRFPAMLSRAVDSLDACGETPCHYLLTSGHEAALLLLLECCGASCDLSLKNKDDLSIFDKAFLAKNTSIIALMVEFAAQDCAQFGSFDSELLLTYACNDCTDQRLLIALICHTSFPIDKIIVDGEAIPAFEFLCSRPDLAISLKKYLTSGRRNTIDFATSFIQGIPLIEYIFDGMNRLPLACIMLECRPEILQCTVPGSQPPTTVLDMLFSDAKKIRFAMSLVERGLVSTASCNVADIRAHLLDASNCEYKTAMQFLACVSEETKKRFIESSSAFNGMSVLHELCAHHVRTQTDLHKLSATAEHEPLRSLHSQRLQSCNNFIREIVSSNSRVVNFQDSEGSTALHIIMSAIEKASSASPALNQLSCDVAHLLIHSGADLTLRNSSGDSPVHLAFRFDCKDFIPLFSEKGFDFASVNASGQTVLHIACEYCFSDSIEKLVSMLSVEVISAGDCDGSTALHTVCRQGKDRLAKLIIAKIGEEIAFSLRNLKNQSPAEVGSKYKDIKKLFAKKK